MGHSAVAAYYDRLTRWNRAARAIGYGGGSEQLTVHRHLSDPRADGRATSTRLHDLLVEALPAIEAPRVLDAGCGLGGTMMALERAWGGSYVGLTVSASQAAIARQAIDAARLSDRIEVRVLSYDAPPEGPFDLVIAVESLVHSADPRASVAALFRVLAPGGRIAVVDDMPEPAARGSQDLEAFRRGWSCGVLLEHGEYLELFRDLGAALATDLDLTPACRPRPSGRIARLARLNRLVHDAVPIRGVRAVMNSHLGGLALERLYREERMRYRLLVARKN